MTLAFALPKTGHPNCRRPDKVIDAGHLVILTAAILVTVFTIWEIVMGFTNQVFKWIGDVANDLGESKANQMFVGVAGGAKGASTGMANANAMKGNTPKPKPNDTEEDPTDATQADKPPKNEGA